MLDTNRDSLVFTFPDIHAGASVTIDFQRTLRIPDDGHQHSLPAGLGKFPIRRVDDHIGTVPQRWREHGGVMTPLWASEALWIAFNGHAVANRGTAYPFAVKVTAGLRSAITGDAYRAGLNPRDYAVVPKQPWLDGFVTGPGVIRQFVAAPLGMGATVEGQLSGKEEHGGLQIDVFPMRADVFERRFPERYDDEHHVLRCCSFGGEPESTLATNGIDMGLAAGGQMKQQVFADTFDFADWDTSHGTRVFVHICNSMMWREITGTDPPHAPLTAKEYQRNGVKWFDYYKDAPALQATPALAAVKPASATPGLLVGDNAVDVASVKPVLLTPQATPPNPHAVRDGSW